MEADTQFRKSFAHNLFLACADIAEGLMRWRVWAGFGWRDVQLRYERSIIGPFWLTISMGIWVLAVGILYSYLFHVKIASYLPHLAVGMIIWSLTTSIINDGAAAFIKAGSYITEIKLPFSVHIYRVLWRNLIVVGHNALVLAAVFLYFKIPLHGFAWLVFPGLLLLIANGTWIGLALGLISARFRDIPPVVTSALQVIFYITPIIWQPTLLRGSKQLIIELNPFSYLIDVLRGPLLGQVPPASSWAVLTIIMVVGWSATLLLFSRYRARLVYWV